MASPTLLPSRRAVFAGLGASAILAAAPGAADPLPDAKLIALCAELDDLTVRLVAADKALMDGVDTYAKAEHDRLWAVLEAANAEWDDCHDAIVGTPATTPDGLRAKAGAVMLSLSNYASQGIGLTVIGDESDPHAQMAWSLACDLVGRA